MDAITPFNDAYLRLSHFVIAVEALPDLDYIDANANAKALFESTSRSLSQGNAGRGSPATLLSRLKRLIAKGWIVKENNRQDWRIK